MRKAQLPTKWPYSSHFYAQFTSGWKQAKWNIRSKRNQMQREEEEEEEEEKLSFGSKVWPLH